MKHLILKSNLAKSIFYLFLVGCLLNLRIESVDAHGISLLAWGEGDNVYVESKFSGGKKVKAGKITVTDPQGTELVKGTTTEEGEFSFKLPKKTDLKIVLLAGQAHRAEWTISAAELEMPAGRKTPATQKSPGIKEIIIGIGCILSLAGIGAYIRKRKKKNLDHESTKI